MTMKPLRDRSPLWQIVGINFRLDPELGFSVTARRGRVSGNNGRLDVFRINSNL